MNEIYIDIENTSVIQNQIDKIKLDDDVEINVIRDDLLIGGTKQRGLVGYMNSCPYSEFVYSYEGFAQISLAQSAKLTGKSCTLFVPKLRRDSIFTRVAESMGAKIVRIRGGYQRYIQTITEKYVNEHENSVLLPFGCNNRFYKDELYQNIKKSILNELTPLRIWIACGSGTTLTVLSEIFPDTHFCLVEIGKHVDIPQSLRSRVSVFKAVEGFHEKCTTPPPYPSLSTYDGKVWQFVIQFGRNGDYIWNQAPPVGLINEPVDAIVNE